jgi:hypothetical protein
MQKFLIVNTKGFSLEQAILAMHTNLQQLHEKSDTSMLEIHTMTFVNTFEKPQKSSLDLNGNSQPVIVYNCCVLLTDKEHNTRTEQLLNKLSSQLAEMINFDFNPAGDLVTTDQPGPSEKEIEELKEGASFIKRSAQFSCKHEHLDPVKHSKAYKNPGQYYQICADCGAEVWNEINEPGIWNEQENKMFIVPAGSSDADITDRLKRDGYDAAEPE